MKDLPQAFVLGAIGLLALSGGPAEATIIPLDSTLTYLHMRASDTGGDAIPIELAPLGISSGDLLRLRIVGDFHYCVHAAHCNPDEEHFGSVAVFSSGSTLLARSLLNRVSGAIDAGADHVTQLSWGTLEPTDIPEDFYLSSFFDVFIEVPVDAKYLFVSPDDSFFGDNHEDDGGDYGLSIEVPEPSALALIVAGAGAALAARRRRRS
jgi:hypothetical protein